MNIPLFIYAGGIFLLGAFISHFLLKDREKQIHKIISFNTTAEKFRNSFDNALLNIDHGEKPITDILNWQYTSHKMSMWRFKYYLTGKTKLNVIGDVDTERALSLTKHTGFNKITPCHAKRDWTYLEPCTISWCEESTNLTYSMMTRTERDFLNASDRIL